MSVISLFGPSGTFKSTFPFTMPGKKWIGDLEYGTDRVTWRFEDKSQYEIWTPPLPDPNDLIQQFTLNRVNKINPGVAGKRELYETIVSTYVSICQRPDIDTIVLDTGKPWWDAITNSYLQELQEGTEKLNEERQKANKELLEPRQQLGEMDYRTPNDRARQFFNVAVAFRKHLVIINHERPKRLPMYNTDKKKVESTIVPGEFEIDSFKETWKLSSWVLETRKDDNGGDVHAIIRKSAIGAELVGKKLQQTYENGVTGFDFNTLDKLVKKFGRDTLSS